MHVRQTEPARSATMNALEKELARLYYLGQFDEYASRIAEVPGGSLASDMLQLVVIFAESSSSGKRQAGTDAVWHARGIALNYRTGERLATGSSCATFNQRQNLVFSRLSDTNWIQSEPLLGSVIE